MLDFSKRNFINPFLSIRYFMDIQTTLESNHPSGEFKSVIASVAWRSPQ